MRTALLQFPAAHPAQTPNIPLLGWIYAQLREAGWKGMEPGLGTCRVRTWASTRGSSCSTFPLTSRARRLRRPLTLPGSSLSLFPAETEKPLKTMEPSQNRSQQAHLLQHQSTTTTTAPFHRDGAVPGHTRTQRMSLPTKGSLGSKSPSQLRSLLQAGSVLSVR